MNAEATHALGAIARDAEVRRPKRPAGSRPVFRIQDLDFWYGANQALHGCSLDIPRGEVTALVGPSGCGKSTFLRMLNRMNDGIEGTHWEGQVALEGEDVLSPEVDVVELRRRVGMVFQKPNPFPQSIFDNVAFGPRLHGGFKKRALEEHVEQCLKRAALWEEVRDRLRASALGLSGGQQQRLCIARALANEPEVLLLDEPCSALDPTATARIEDLIFELRGRYTIIIVTHNMQQAARVSDKTAFFLKGRVIEFGPTVDIFTGPKKRETERYITGRFG